MLNLYPITDRPFYIHENGDVSYWCDQLETDVRKHMEKKQWCWGIGYDKIYIIIEDLNLIPLVNSTTSIKNVGNYNV